MTTEGIRAQRENAWLRQAQRPYEGVTMARRKARRLKPVPRQKQIPHTVRAFFTVGCCCSRARLGSG